MFDQLSFKDLKLIYEIPHHESLQSLSRALKIEPQNISKIIKRIEGDLNLKLINRSSTGSTPTSEALELAEIAKKILNISHDFLISKQVSDKKIIDYTFVSRVFLNACLSGVLTSASENELSDIRFKFIDASPKKKEIWARKGLIDLILSVEQIDLGKNWTHEKVGEFHWNFYGKKNHPIGTTTRIEQLLKYPLVLHSHIDGDRMIDMKTVSNLKISPKILGHSSENTINTLKIISKTNQIGFLPDILYNEGFFNNEIQKISLEKNFPFKQSLYLSAHVDRVNQIHYKRILNILKKYFMKSLNNGA